MDIFQSQGEKGQKDNDRFLLVPGDIVKDGKVINVLQAENFL